MYRDTVTLYNKYQVEGKDYWQPTILKDVDVNVTNALTESGAGRGYRSTSFGTVAEDTAKLHIKLKGEKSNITVQEHGFKFPKDWKSSSSVAGCITFQPDCDFFWIGEETDLSPKEDESFMSGTIGGFYDYMNKNHDNVYVITNYSVFSVIPHFEVIGK